MSKPKFVYTTYIETTPEKLWEALTTSEFSKRYWFGTRVNLNKLVVQYRQQHAARDFAAEIVADLRDQTESGGPGTTWRVLVDLGTDLPEQRALTLLLLPPALQWSDDETGRDRVRARPRSSIWPR